MRQRSSLNIALILLVLLGVLAFAGAFWSYTGSTYYDHTTSRYLFWENTISESGMTQNYRGETLLWSPIFFSLGIFCLATSTALFFWKLTRQATIRGIAIIASALLILLPFFPVDTHNAAHNYLFFGVIGACTITFCLLALELRTLPLKLLACTLGAYTLFLILNPSTTTTHTIHTIHVVTQKVILLATVATVLFTVATNKRLQ